MAAIKQHIPGLPGGVTPTGPASSQNSVLDSGPEKVMRLVMDLLGAGDPASAVMPSPLGMAAKLPGGLGRGVDDSVGYLKDVAKKFLEPLNPWQDAANPVSRKASSLMNSIQLDRVVPEASRALDRRFAQRATMGQPTARPRNMSQAVDQLAGMDKRLGPDRAHELEDLIRELTAKFGPAK